MLPPQRQMQKNIFKALDLKTAALEKKKSTSLSGTSLARFVSTQRVASELLALQALPFLYWDPSLYWGIPSHG